ALILYDVLLYAQRAPGLGCQIVQTNNIILAANFICSMGLDAIIFTLTTWKPVNKHSEASSQL
ncbi:hypothetical protein CERSUDRAFT_37791, partial [Gelatoporia subvermispora B]